MSFFYFKNQGRDKKVFSYLHLASNGVFWGFVRSFFFPFFYCFLIFSILHI